MRLPTSWCLVYVAASMESVSLSCIVSVCCLSYLYAGAQSACFSLYGNFPLRYSTMCCCHKQLGLQFVNLPEAGWISVLRLLSVRIPCYCLGCGLIVVVAWLAA
jgi:hypothetical protein